MTTPPHRLLHLLIWAVCLPVSLALVLWLPIQSLVGIEPGPSVPPRPMVYVLLGVDTLAEPQPRIEAVWLASVPPDHTTIDLLGLPPALFRNHFTAPDGLTDDVLQPYAPGRDIVGSIIFARSDLAEFADRLGGVWLNGARADGGRLLAFMDEADSTQPKEVLIRQGAVIQSLLAELSIQNISLDPEMLINSPGFMSVEQSVLLNTLGYYYPVHTSKFRFRIRTEP